MGLVSTQLDIVNGLCIERSSRRRPWRKRPTSILSKRGNGSNSLHAVLQHNGAERASFLIGELTDAAQGAGLGAPFAINTPYINTLSADRGEHASWDRDIEHRIRSIIRWNAVAIILRANKHSSELGGHIASFQSAATLYDIGFGHFWHAPTDKHGGDLIYIQGHSAPGIYARAFVEGRLTEEQLLNFRQETGVKACPPIRIPGSCRISGNFRPCPWGSGR